MILTTHMITLIVRFRRICRLRYPEDIDPLPEDARAKELGFVVVRDDVASLLGSRNKPIDAMCRLMKSPRLLKIVFRTTYRSWEHLHGELDFEDMLVADVLRYAAPEAFEFLLENIQEIRGLETEGILKDRDARSTAINKKWDHATEKVHWDTTSAKQLIQFIFPCWGKGKKSGPQGLQVQHPVDYWARYLLGELQEDDARDQEILHSIMGWLKNPDDQHSDGSLFIQNLCSSGDFSLKFEHLAPYTLDGNNIRSIATRVFAEAIKLQGVKACSDSVPGFIPLWRRAIRDPIKESEHLAWIQEEIFKAMPLSLQFSNDLYYYWRSNAEFEIHVKPNRGELRKNIKLKAMELFSENTALFISTLDPEQMFSSYHFCMLYYSPEQGGNGFSCADWQWFSALLLDAGEMSPQIIVPQLVCFVVSEQHNFKNISISFNSAFAEEFFGTEMMPRLMQLLSKEIQLDCYDPQEINRIQVAKEFALNSLAQHLN